MKIILIGRGEIFYKVYLYLYQKNYLKLIIFDNRCSKSKPRFYNLIKKNFRNYIIVSDINNPRIINKINKEKFDYILSVNNHQIFGDIFLKKFKNKIFNYHNSLIPNFKGLHSISKAIISNQNVTGISWHLVKKEIDNGPVIFSKKIKIYKSDTAASLTLKCNLTCVKYISNFLTVLKRNHFKFKKNKRGNDINLSKEILHLKTKLKFSHLDRIVRAFEFYPFKNNFGYPFIFLKKKKILIRKIIFHSKNKYLCRKYIDTNSVLVKFLDTYVVFKKIL